MTNAEDLAELDPCRSVEHLGARAKLAVLFGKAVARDPRALVLALPILAVGRDAADALAVVDQLVLVAPATVEHRPLRRLGGAGVMVDQVRDKVATTHREPGCAVVYGLAQSRAATVALGLLCALLDIGLWSLLHPPRQVGRPAGQQPIPQALGVFAIDLVVIEDGGQQRRIAGLFPAIIVNNRLVGLGDRLIALCREENFECLQAQRWLRGPNRLAGYRIEVDELLAAEQRVELVLAGRICCREATQRRDLIGGIMINMRRRMPGDVVGEEIDHRFERAALLVVVVGPVGTEQRIVGLPPVNAPEIFEAVRV